MQNYSQQIQETQGISTEIKWKSHLKISSETADQQRQGDDLESNQQEQRQPERKARLFTKPC